MAWPIFGQPPRCDDGQAGHIVVYDIALDPATGWVVTGGRLVRAPARASHLLERLMRHPGTVVAVDVVAGGTQMQRDSIDRLARYPRRRLMVDLLRPPLIEVITGSGYRYLPLGAVATPASQRDGRPHTARLRTHPA
jgi:DNA-binding response OmpR family regulator